MADVLTALRDMVPFVWCIHTCYARNLIGIISMGLPIHEGTNSNALVQDGPKRPQKQILIKSTYLVISTHVICHLKVQHWEIFLGTFHLFSSCFVGVMMISPKHEFCIFHTESLICHCDDLDFQVVEF